MAALVLSLPAWAVVIALIGLAAAFVYIFFTFRSDRE